MSRVKDGVEIIQVEHDQTGRWTRDLVTCEMLAKVARLHVVGWAYVGFCERTKTIKLIRGEENLTVDRNGDVYVW